MRLATLSIAETPDPPYIAVIFTSLRSGEDQVGYAETATAMDQLAAEQPGYLGVESARNELGIRVSYWASAADALAWKQIAEHLVAQRLGQRLWYDAYQVRVATVTRQYGRP